jgi:HK97 family phage portal protein
MSLKDRMIEWLGGQSRIAESGFYPEGTTTSPSAWLVNLVQYGPNQSETAAGQPINETIAEGIAAIYACVHIISETVGQLPLKLYRKQNGGKEPDTNHPLYSVLHDLANTEMTAIEFREMQTRHLALYGRSYAQILRNPRNEVTALWPLHPSRMFVDRDPLNRKRFRYYMGKGEYATFLHDPAKPPILHLRINSEDGLDGRSPLVINRESLAITKAADTYQAAWFGNGAIPGMVLTHPGKLSDKAKENLRKSWLDKFMGARKSNRVAILEEDIKVNVVGVDPQKSQLDALRKLQIEEAARIYRVPLFMIQSQTKDTSWGSGIEQQMLGFVNMTLMPWLVAWQQAVGRDLLSAKAFETHEALFVLNALVRGDIKTRYDAYAVGRQNGFLNGDDIAEIEDLNPLPNGAGKMYWMPSNYQPILGGGLPAVIEPDTSTPSTTQPMSNEPKGVM